MRAGNFNRMVELVRDVETGRDDYNQPVVEPSTVATFWASKIFKSEDEQYAASQVYATRVVTFRSHHIEDVRPTDRLVCEGETFNIRGTREIGYREGIEITAQSTTA